jgi:uncharacterized membrane protein YfcA
MFSSYFPTYFHLWHLPAIFAAGLIGEGYATVIGSGGVLIQFVLASLGLPMTNVVATDLAGCMGADAGIIITSTSPQKVWKKKKLLFLLATPLALGGMTGTVFLIYIPAVLLKCILIAGLSLLLLHILSSKQSALRTLDDFHIDLKQAPVLFILLFILGIYGNVSGVGSGTFMKLVFISLLRVSFVDSLGIGSMISLPASLFSLIATAMAGLIVWPYCLTLWVGTFIGGRYGTKFARKVPDRYLYGLLILVVSLYLVWLLASL